jgi:hypothetical protein
MSRQVIVLGLLSMLLVGGSCGSSCVNFDGQTVRLAVDESKDRLDGLFLYRGLHSTTGDTTQALEQLEEIRGGERWFAVLSNWPFMFPIDKWVAEERDAERPAASRLLDTLDRHVEVRNGPLWLDADGTLNAWQLVRVRELAEVVAAANAAQVEQVELSLAEADGKGGWPVGDDESVALLKEALRRGDPFWAFDGQALTFTLPASDEGWVKIKRAMLDGLREMVEVHDEDEKDGDEKSNARRESDALIDFLAINDWSVEREPGRTLFVLGARSADELRIEVPTVGLDGTDLVQELRERGWAIMPAGDDATAHAAYEAFRGED